ncbi:MAG TPA: DUF192 domain-containing protein [Bryobacteraceae bacterium]|nr:DUF192 domain-containing protein [Bryobacteraceae bacterium]
MRYVFLLFSALLLGGCGPKPTSVDDFSTRPVTLPGGQVIRAETMIDQIDVARGLMFRTSLAPDHGMLFVHAQPGIYRHWMYQVLIPLDIVWLNSKHDIVEIVENAPPCKTKASQCPQYGGKQLSSYILELNAGMARKYGLQLGQAIQW